MEPTKIRLPYNYEPRDYQLPVLEALDNGINRAVCVWHRRSGKDKTFLNYVAKKMYERVGSYYYYFPTYKQAKKVIWNGMDKDGYRFIDHFPEQLRKRVDSGDMLIEMQNGSIFQLIGTDNLESIVGPNPVGCVFSEYSLQNPAAWDYVRPILAENGGWAAFIYTPRGRNHGWNLLETARQFPDVWFTQVLTVNDTHSIPVEILEQERREIILKNGNDALYQQEYFCNFAVPLQGAYYAAQLMKAEEEGRITGVPLDGFTAVHTAWDLGIDDSMAIWFFQVAGREIHFVDYYENSGEGMGHYAKILQDKQYNYGTHYAPFDIEVRELSTGKTRLETAKQLGLRFEVVPKLGLEDGINACRAIFPRCWFDKIKCERGLNALRSYHKDWDEENQVYRLHPVHDWSSHSCLVGDSLVLTDNGSKRIDQIKIGDMVQTPVGNCKVLNAGISKIVDSLLEIQTNKGKIQCTPEHKFFTNRGVVCADALRYNDSIWTQETSLSELPFKGLHTNFRDDIMSLPQVGLPEQNTVAKVVRVNLVTSNNTPVYDLTVDKHHCYYANGLLVSNSDAFRTFAVGFRDKVASMSARPQKIIVDPYDYSNI